VSMYAASPCSVSFARSIAALSRSKREIGATGLKSSVEDEVTPHRSVASKVRRAQASCLLQDLFLAHLAPSEGLGHITGLAADASGVQVATCGFRVRYVCTERSKRGRNVCSFG
jgi:hypothetical protein